MCLGSLIAQASSQIFPVALLTCLFRLHKHLQCNMSQTKSAFPTRLPPSTPPLPSLSTISIPESYQLQARNLDCRPFYLLLSGSHISKSIVLLPEHLLTLPLLCLSSSAGVETLHFHQILELRVDALLLSSLFLILFTLRLE